MTYYIMFQIEGAQITQKNICILILRFSLTENMTRNDAILMTAVLGLFIW
jgi:hypothetical protein